MPLQSRLVCQYCLKDFQREQARLSHIRQTLYCRRADDEARHDRPMPVTENPHGLDDFETMEDDPPLSDNAINDESDALDDLMDIFERLPKPPCQRPSTPPLTKPAAPKSPAPSRATPEDADVDVYPGAGKVFPKGNHCF